MDATLIVTLIILVLGILFVLGLIAPKKFTTWGGSNPHRGKAFFYLIAGFVLTLVLGTMADDALMKKIQETPEEITELDLSNKDLSSFPDYLSTLINLDDLNLSENQLTSIDDNIKGLNNLYMLNLSNNPITSLPDWILDLENLRHLDVYFTDIDSSALSIIKQLEAKGATVNYDLNYRRADNQNLKEEEVEKWTEGEVEDEHAESFTEYAKRRLLEGRGGDAHRRKYGKGEIFYESGMDHAMLDSLGAALTDLGLFTPDKEVSVQLSKKDDVYKLEVVTMYEDKEDITEDIELSWHFIAIMIKSRVFPEQKMELHLVDQRMNLFKIISPAE